MRKGLTPSFLPRLFPSAAEFHRGDVDLNRLQGDDASPAPLLDTLRPLLSSCRIARLSDIASREVAGYASPQLLLNHPSAGNGRLMPSKHALLVVTNIAESTVILSLARDEQDCVVFSERGTTDLDAPVGRGRPKIHCASLQPGASHLGTKKKACTSHVKTPSSLSRQMFLLDEGECQLAVHGTDGQLRTILLPSRLLTWKRTEAKEKSGGKGEIERLAPCARDAAAVPMLFTGDVGPQASASTPAAVLVLPRSDSALLGAARAADAEAFTRLLKAASSYAAHDLLHVAVQAAAPADAVGAICRALLWGPERPQEHGFKRTHDVAVGQLDRALECLTYCSPSGLRRVPFELALARGQVVAACEMALFAMVMRHLSLALKGDALPPTSCTGDASELLLLRFCSRDRPATAGAAGVTAGATGAAVGVLVSLEDAAILAMGALPDSSAAPVVEGKCHTFAPLSEAPTARAQLAAWCEGHHASVTHVTLPAKPDVPAFPGTPKSGADYAVPPASNLWSVQDAALQSLDSSILDKVKDDDARGPFDGIHLQAEGVTLNSDLGICLKLDQQHELEILPDAVPLSMPAVGDQANVKAWTRSPLGGLRQRGESDTTLARLLRGTWAVYNSTSIEGSLNELSFAYCMVMDSDDKGRVFGMDCPWSHPSRSEELPFFFR